MYVSSVMRFCSLSMSRSYWGVNCCLSPFAIGVFWNRRVEHVNHYMDLSCIMTSTKPLVISITTVPVWSAPGVMPEGRNCAKTLVCISTFSRPNTLAQELQDGPGDTELKSERQVVNGSIHIYCGCCGSNQPHGIEEDDCLTIVRCERCRSTVHSQIKPSVQTEACHLRRESRI